MYLYNRVFPYFSIIRPDNCIGSLLLVAISYLGAASENPNFSLALMTGLGVGLSAGAGSVINDLFDQRADLFNAPYRMLPQGRIRKNEATIYYLCLLAIALGLFWMIGLRTFLAGLLCNGLLFLYSWKIKQIHGLLAHATIALLVATMLSFGALAMGAIDVKAAVLFAVWFLISFSREIIDSVTDLEGDKLQGGVKTLPIIIGIKSSLTVAAILLFVAATFTFTPIFTGVFSEAWQLYALGISGLFVISVRHSIQKIREWDTGRVSTLLKATIFCYPLALTVPAFLP